MAFFYLVLILIIIPFIVVFFLAGIILLIIGIVNKSKPKNAGRKFPTVCMSLGGTLLVLPALIVAIGIVPRIFGGFYSSVPEHWQNAWVGDTQAADEAIKALMEAAGNGDGRFLRFAPLTLVPLDPALIDPAYLTPQTREVLNRYHSRVYVEIAPLLTEEERNWLRLQTRPV